MGHPLKYKPVIANHVLILQKPFSFQGAFLSFLPLQSIQPKYFYLERHLDKKFLFTYFKQLHKYCTSNRCVKTEQQTALYIYHSNGFIQGHIDVPTFITKNFYQCIQFLNTDILTCTLLLLVLTSTSKLSRFVTVP